MLPDYWDDLAGDNPYLKKRILLLMEETHDFGQRYHVVHDNGPCAIFVTSRTKLEAAIPGKRNLRVPVTVTGIPVPVSLGGYSIKKREYGRFIEAVTGLKGLKLIVQAREELYHPALMRIRNIPCYYLDQRFASFDDYTGAMRSPYRRRINQAVKRCRDITTVVLDDSSAFDRRMYDLYTSVYENARYRTGRINIDLFRKMPVRTYRFDLNQTAVGFIQTLPNGPELLFFKGGMDPSCDRGPDLYFFMLLTVIRQGIEEGFERVCFGQTGDDTKLRLGCRPEPRYIYLSHSNRTVHSLLSRHPRTRPEKTHLPRYRVFRDSQYARG